MRSHRIAFNDICWYTIPDSNGADSFGPVAFKCRVFAAPSIGGVEWRHRRPWKRTDKVLLCEIGSIPNHKGALLWINKEPLLDARGKLAVDGDGAVVTPATHVATQLGVSWDGFLFRVAAAVVPVERRQ